MPKLRTGRWPRILAALLLLGAIIWLAGPARIAQTMRSADPRWIALGLSMNVVANAIAAMRWRELTRWFGMTVGRAWALVTYFHGVAVSAVLPGAVVGGDVLRAVALQRAGNPGLDAGLSVLLDRLSGLWMLCVVGCLAVAWNADHESMRHLFARWPTLASAPLAQAALLAAGALLVAPWAGIVALRRWLPGGSAGQRGEAARNAEHGEIASVSTSAAGGDGERAHRMDAPDEASNGSPPAVDPAAPDQPDGGKRSMAPAPLSAGRLIRLRAIIRAGHAGPHYLAQIVLSGIVQLLAIGSLVCAARALQIDIGFGAMAVSTVPIFILATLPVSFGGWGTREAAAVVALGAFGVAAPDAVTISVFYGLYGLVQALGGLVRHRQQAA